MSPGDDERRTLQDQLKFAKANGISDSDFIKAYNSFGVQANLQHADDLDRRYKIDGVPTFVINGKYESDVAWRAASRQSDPAINDLAASEKHAEARESPSPPRMRYACRACARSSAG